MKESQPSTSSTTSPTLHATDSAITPSTPFWDSNSQCTHTHKHTSLQLSQQPSSTPITSTINSTTHPHTYNTSSTPGKHSSTRHCPQTHTSHSTHKASPHHPASRHSPPGLRSSHTSTPVYEMTHNSNFKEHSQQLFELNVTNTSSTLPLTTTSPDSTASEASTHWHGTTPNPTTQPQP